MSIAEGKGTCSKPDCTVADTGICLVGHATPQLCEFYSIQSVVPILAKQADSDSDAPEGRGFHSGVELGTEDLLPISTASYAHVIGLVGAYNAGKTCFLLSLYMMASRQLLPNGYLFAGSLTLQGFEDRARRLREWKGGALPKQLADHTSSTEERKPGFLHLNLTSGDRRLQLLLPDLPGEWTKSLIKQGDDIQSWSFLNRADGIIIVLDGTELVGAERIVHLTRAKHLLHRLRDSVHVPTDMPMVLLISKADEIEMKSPVLLEELTGEARQIGFSPRTILCASFSRTPDFVPNGQGVFEAIEFLLSESHPIERIPPAQHSDSGRSFRSYRYSF